MGTKLEGMIVQATIKIDLGPLASEWEAVAFRIGDPGEHVFGSNGQPHKLTDPTCYQHLIIRRKWTWPAGLKAAAMAMDMDGQWWVHETKPHINRNCWDSEGDVMSCHLWAFDLPECGDWKQSLRENPNGTPTNDT